MTEIVLNHFIQFGGDTVTLSRSVPERRYFPETAYMVLVTAM